MKKLSFLFLLLFIFSCSKTDSTKPWMIEETKQIINDYPDTLIESIQDAKKVRQQYDENGKELEESIKNSKIN